MDNDNCFYCKAPRSLNYPTTQVRVATKPKGHTFRWKKIGVCCDACENAGAKTQYEYGETPPATTKE